MRLALALACALVACTVPRLEDLEKERVRECDADHLCAAGYTCVRGQCLAEGAGGECTAGQTRACGSSTGECVPGQQSCGGDLKFGACVGEIAPVDEICDGLDNDCDGASDDNLTTSPACPLSQGVCAGKRRRCLSGTLEPACVAASYGADYEQSELRCDGLDNDCDGQVDEGLMQTCALQLGVCAGASQACRPDGGVCTAATYGAHSSDYQAFESSCDGRDNDCDGLVDAWPLLNISNSPGVVSTRAAAARLQSGAVLVLWQEGQKVRGAAVSPTGGVSASTEPSTSSEAAVRSFLPALASDGPITWAAWVENGADGGVGVRAAPLDATGRSTAPSAGAFQFPGPISAAPADLSVAVDGTAQVALVVVQNGTALEVASYTQAGQMGASTTVLGQGIRPRAAPAGNGNFWVSFQAVAAAPNYLCLLQASANPIAGSCFVAQNGADWPFVLPLNQAAPYEARLGFVNGYPDGGADFHRRRCDAGACGLSVAAGFSFSPLAAEFREASVSRTSGPALTTWEDATTTTGVYYYPSDAGVPLRAAPSLNASRRPVPLMLGPGRAAVVFDTEGNSGGGFPADEVVLQRLCVP